MSTELPENLETPLQAFRKRINGIVERDRELGNANFNENFKSRDLNESDLELYRRFEDKENPIDPMELANRLGMDFDLDTLKPKFNDSQKQLAAYLVQRMMEKRKL